jgi:uncharacterized protein (TIGR01777 family)
MNITVTGATGLIGRAVVAQLLARGDSVTVLSRDPDRAREKLGGEVEAFAWKPESERAPVEALGGRDGIVHLAGESVAQRWSADAKRRIEESRSKGTANLVDGLRAADPRPGVLVSASATGYYGPHGDEEVTEETPPPPGDFLADVFVEWEQAASAARKLDMRVVLMRTGIVLDKGEGALGTMLTPFKLGVGGPVAGGAQYMPWIHLDDVAGMYVAALTDDRWSGPVNVSAPEPVTNKAFSKALGKALHRPAFAPVPGFMLKLLYGEMSEIVTTGVRAVPARATELGYAFRHPDLDEALEAALR